jgi:hypothetical protein
MLTSSNIYTISDHHSSPATASAAFAVYLSSPSNAEGYINQGKVVFFLGAEARSGYNEQSADYSPWS